MDEIICLIPAYEPDEKLVNLVREGLAYGISRFLVVDDGSSAECKAVFRELEAMGITVLVHKKNMGKGAALRTGIGYIITNFDDVKGIVTADADGQHKMSDIIRVGKEILLKPSELTLGVRSFDTDNVPFRSRMGNRMTAAIFRLLTGIDLGDTQTGLRGIPLMYFNEAMKVEGNRYEYEMNFLLDMAGNNVHFNMVPIETVYIGENRSSHFHVIRDSFLIYRRPLTFASMSLGCSVLDIGMFALFSNVVFSGNEKMIIPSTVFARIISGATNFALNKLVTFKSRGHSVLQTVKYLVLFVTIMLISGGLVSLLSFIPIPNWIIKIFVDVCLFFVNYIGQKKWVFKE